MEYRLIFGSMLATEEDDVNEACKEGWQPHGSLAFADLPPVRWVQPMVRQTTMLSETYEAAREFADWTRP